MTSTLTSPNTSAKGSKIPIPKPTTSDSTVREDLSASELKKPPFQTRKSAEELKLRLASAVSAKIALSKDGRTSSNNRGIGFLLQRKEQENRLNTKDISFQKPARNGVDKTVEAEGKNPNSSAKSPGSRMNKTELQKSLLSALMNSRSPSGANSSQSRVKDTRLGAASKLSPPSIIKDKTRTSEFNKTPSLTPKATSKNVAEESQLGTVVNSGQSRNSAVANGSKFGSSSTTKSKTGTSELNKTPMTMSTSNSTGRNVASKSQSGNVHGQNGTSGGILERAKNIENLLGQRKQNNESIKPNAATKNGTLNVNGKDTEPKQEITFSSGENETSFKLNKNVKTTQSVENVEIEGAAIIEGKHNEKVGLKKTVEKRQPEENFRKKIPPHVAKKPSKEIIQMSKQGASPSASGIDRHEPPTCGNLGASTQDGIQITSKDNVKQIQKTTSPSKVNSSSLRTAPALNRVNYGKGTAFRELDLLEKLEADIGSCKIAAFQSMEDFSALRMKVYSIRGELDQLKRDREKRTPLVC